ncbi:MAG: GNAT family N-acetyltransferase [Gammaproteobacteria bacterium]|nr:GNAT family N-acetyltransferase [Gammaproteobacteria bacterium]
MKNINKTYYENLNWDTDFFGLQTSKITRINLNNEELSTILIQLKNNNKKLVYYSSINKINPCILKNFNGKLTDKKTTFNINLDQLENINKQYYHMIKPYDKSMPTKDIENLAIQSGEYSRFSIDKNIPREKFIALYKIWANKSIKKEISDEVLVIQEKTKIIGIITLGNKNGVGDIGLVAIDRDHRGKKYGEKLVRSAQSWFIQHRYKFGQVVTQGTNIPACNLYKKCGYSIQKEEYFYHFWL